MNADWGAFNKVVHLDDGWDQDAPINRSVDPSEVTCPPCLELGPLNAHPRYSPEAAAHCNSCMHAYVHGEPSPMPETR